MSLGQVLTGWLRPPPSAVIPAADPSPIGEIVLRSASRSHVGRVRPINEDRVLDCSARGLWAIADGMGGHAAGDVAAEAAVAALQRLPGDGPVEPAAVEASLAVVNQELRRRAREGAPLSGATIVLLLRERERMRIAWAGDCRAYRLRNGRLDQLTRDHSVVQDLIDAGALTAEAAARHPHAHVVTRALGAGDDLSLDHVSTGLSNGDLYLLCSDGLPNAPVELSRILLDCPELEPAADRLLQHALASGGQDNISLILVQAVAAPD